MADRRSPTQGQRWIGFLIGCMAVAIAVAPLAVAAAIPGREDSAVIWLLVLAGVLWILAVAIYRGISKAHERWRRRLLRNEIAQIRQARLDASEVFQETLYTQIAVLDRIIDIADSLLTDGIIDPMTALENVRMVASHADEAKGFAEEAIAEVRIETGAASFEPISFDIRNEIETIATPYVRAGHNLSTTGNRCFAYADPSAVRIIVRGLISQAIEQGADEVDVAVARNDDRIVCLVAATGSEPAMRDVGSVPPVSAALASAIGSEIEHNYALGWSTFAFALPSGDPIRSGSSSTTPLDSLAGVRRDNGDNEPNPTAAQLRRLTHDEVIAFTLEPDREQLETVADRRREPLEAR